MSRIRTLKPGEPVPTSEPAGRYVNSAGYVRLRWKTDDGLVECYEHRAVVGNPADRQVHHINHNRDDNRPENLRIVTTSEHGVEHRTLPDAEIVRLYATGLSTPAVGARIGVDPGNVLKALQRNNITIRPGSSYLRRSLDDSAIRRLHAAGVRSRRIAGVLGVSPETMDRRLRELGLSSFRTGRPTNAEIAACERAIAEALR